LTYKLDIDEIGFEVDFRNNKVFEIDSIKLDNDERHQDQLYRELLNFILVMFIYGNSQQLLDE
ncbi:11814_t:CDS:1, partial [Funneliformis mosseae]